MTFEELKKKLKQAQDIKISFQEFDNNEFIATIKGIINSMEKKKSKLDQIIDELKEIRLDIIELKSDVAILKQDMIEVKSDVNELKIDVKQLKSEAIKHGWDIK